MPDQGTTNLIIFAEQMAALLAQTILELRGILTGSSSKTSDQILTEADTTYQAVIDSAKNPPPPPTGTVTK